MKGMQKISRGTGFRGVFEYLLEDERGSVFGGNMSSNSVRDLAREMGAVRALRPDIKRPVWHNSLRLPAGERIDTERWRVIADDYMTRMGFADDHPRAYIMHDDDDGQHIHIVANRISLSGKVYLGQHENLASTRHIAALEREYELQITKGTEVSNERAGMKKGEIEMGIKTGEAPPRLRLQELIDKAAEDRPGAREFVERLEAAGVTVTPNVASTGRLNGFAFELDGIAFKGSQLGPAYSWTKQLKDRVSYEQDRDFEPLSARAVAARAADRRERADAAADSGHAAGRGGGRDSGGAGAAGSATPGRAAGAGGIRPSDGHPAADAGRADAADERERGGEHGAASLTGRQDAARDERASAELASSDRGGGGQRQGHAGPAAADRGIGGAGSRADAEQRWGSSAASRPSPAPPLAAGAGADSGRGRGRDAGSDWASRFKQASAAKRRAADGRLGQRDLEQGHAQGARVAETDRQSARELDPTAYLEAQGFQVIKEGRHLSVRQHGDEAYRVTRKDDGHWVTCDRFENGIGDNIALVQELEPGSGFAESVYRLSGAPSVARATRPAPAPVKREPPKMPAQDPADVRRGRAYLFERGITLETIEQAEKAGMLRYSARGVLFVGRDDAGTAQNIMRRAVDASELVQKRDLFGTDKRHPQMLLGATDTVLIVEGGTDALAAVDIARREKRPAPTVLVSGGANVKGFMQTPWVQKVLKLAKKVIVAFEREATPEAQAKTDAAHLVQMQRLREVCSAQVTGWKPPEGIKDMAALNLHQVQRAWEREQERSRGMGMGMGR